MSVVPTKDEIDEMLHSIGVRSTLIMDSCAAGDMLARVLPRRWSEWRWGVFRHPHSGDVFPVLARGEEVRFLADN